MSYFSNKIKEQKNLKIKETANFYFFIISISTSFIFIAFSTFNFMKAKIVDVRFFDLETFAISTVLAIIFFVIAIIFLNKIKD